MKLVVNGEETTVGERLTITELLEQQQVKMPEMVSVELNGRILKRTEFESTKVQDGDKIEFLYFMGGGKWG